MGRYVGLDVLYFLIYIYVSVLPSKITSQDWVPRIWIPAHMGQILAAVYLAIGFRVKTWTVSQIVSESVEIAMAQ